MLGFALPSVRTAPPALVVLRILRNLAKVIARSVKDLTKCGIIDCPSEKFRYFNKTDVRSCRFHHTVGLRCGENSERQSARMSKITNDGLTWSGTGCFIAVPIWQLGRQRVNVVQKEIRFVDVTDIS